MKVKELIEILLQHPMDAEVGYMNRCVDHGIDYREIDSGVVHGPNDVLGWHGVPKQGAVILE